MLRLQLGTQGALEIAGEGPDLGSAESLACRALDTEGGADGSASPSSPPRAATSARRSSRRSRTSPTTRMSRWASSTRSPTPTLWRELEVPGSPFAIALDAGGTVLAKGTFNNLAQLESVLATAARRRAQGSRKQAGPAEGPCGGCRSVPEHLDRLSDSLARDTSRRGFLARVGGALVGRSPAARTVGDAWSSPASPRPSTSAATPTRPAPARIRPGCRGSTRAASRSAPATGSRSTTSAGPVNDAGQPVDDQGQLLRDPDGRPAAAGAPDAALRRGRRRSTASAPHIDGAWYRCCGGKVRKLTDCCAHRSTRINGDAALTGYCYARPQGVLRHVLRHEGAVLM